MHVLSQRRMLAVLGALVTGLAGGGLGALVTPPAPRVAAGVTGSPSVTGDALDAVPAPLGAHVLGRVLDVEPAQIAVITAMGITVDVHLGATTQYLVYGGPSTAGRTAVVVGRWVVVRGHAMGSNDYAADTVVSLMTFHAPPPGFFSRRQLP